MEMVNHVAIARLAKAAVWLDCFRSSKICGYHADNLTSQHSEYYVQTLLCRLTAGSPKIKIVGKLQLMLSNNATRKK